ncbi:S-layer homology domain-containing protein [Dysosmobacter sp.]|uniref:S-layer homology domain-containing protein n=1 Tax=Dysosmobacter sp. TaxID=2591382 RepID=UPI002620C494|nr:S-layer homology domain-containing protein [Dysosmobacter sp.]
MKKRILSVILTLTLCAGLSVPAFAARAFTDVPADYWAYDAIQYVTDEGLFSGTSGSTFTPGGTMTRAMLWVVLARMDGVDTSAASGAWYQAGLDWAVEAGISDGTNANGSITRAQFAAMLYRYAEYAGVDTAADTTELNKFADTGSIPSYAVEPLAWAVTNGIVSGTSATTISPSGSATRAQVATMLMRYAQAFGDGQTVDPGETVTEPETPDVDYKLTIALMNSSLSVGDKVFADVNTIPATAADDLTFTFKSSDTSVVTVKASSRNHFSCDITAVGPGTAIITATDSNGVTTTRTITVTGSSSNPGTSTSDEYADVKDEIIALTNEVRAENNAGALSKSDLLMQIAQQRAEESADNETIRHIRPNGDFYDTIFAEYGLDIYSMNYQEILCWGPTDSVDAVMEAWVNSQGHFNSMTNPNMIFVGVGVAKGANGYYFCQIFTNKDRT